MVDGVMRSSEKVVVVKDEKNVTTSLYLKMLSKTKSGKLFLQNFYLFYKEMLEESWSHKKRTVSRGRNDIMKETQ